MSSYAVMEQAQMGRDAYTDLGSVQAIRAIKNKSEALQQVAEQFESMMLRTMLKSMRDANKVFSEGNMLSSHEENTYRDMLDDQLTLTLSQDGGMGIAEVMVRQLQRSYGGSSQSDAVVNRGVNEYLGKRNNVTPVMPSVNREQETLLNKVRQMLPESLDFDGTVERFVSNLYPLAQKAAQALGIDPRALLAQSALETGWGRKLSRSPDGDSSFNFFNIKADRRWDGNSVSVSTLENRDGVSVRERADFRVYESPEHSFDDYVSFLSGNARYEKALQCTDSQSFIEELAEAGYATDANYADKIISIMNDTRLNAAIDAVQH